MKKETFEQASVLNAKIEYLDSAIKNIEAGKKHACNGAMHVIKHFKAKKAKYEKEFEQLK